MGALLSPPILFFALGMLATLFRSGLKIPYPIPKLLSLYLLFAIGLRGGVELHEAGFSWSLVWTMLAAMGMASLMPLVTYSILRLKLRAVDAGAIAAAYGSISAVTFITAQAVLDSAHIPHSGSLVAAMALMESPAIVVAVLLVRQEGAKYAEQGSTGQTAAKIEWGKLLHEAFLNGPVFLLLGSMAVGLITGAKGRLLLEPFSDKIFAGILCFFLLDLGLLAARRLRDLGKAGPFCITFAIVAPVVQAGVGLLLARVLKLNEGDTLLFMMLAGSASYIAVPAALRLVIPEANAGLYVPMALAITFPLNVTIGIPVYLSIVRWLLE
ncbi:MAG: sodium-dependent bicarbonate transport family permease [Planctomycetota bacterium]|nr:sodium-dependent bicarbonate transport family permease [Planctomycetota bacterium]